MTDRSARLQRHLGLYAVFTISVGAMIGSGIFVLPGLAFVTAGPSLILAYFVAGVVVLPAALSQAEMATAIPKAGGAYLYIDRAMGPLLGTVAGLGVWFSLVFKAAFALDGLGSYLALLTTFPAKPVALTLGAALIALNLIGVQETGRFQSLLVTGVFAVLLVFIAVGSLEVERERFHPFFAGGPMDLLAATGIIFVSYAGVTKVASVAEEVERPTRNLPIGIISSVLVMMFIYPAVVYVMVGTSPPEELAGSTTPVSLAGATFLGETGGLVLAGVAVVALVSMANAGMLASSRYPLAMARRRLAPAWLGTIGRANVPVAGIALTGGLLLALVAFVPILQLAKLASAFQLLTFALINLAVVVFRRADLWWYRPKFRSPGYPWVQIAGIVACGVLLTEMGLLPLLGAVGMVAAGVAWYQVYGRSRALRESAVKEAARQQTNARLLDQTRSALTDGARSVSVLAPFPGEAEGLERIADTLAGPEGSVSVTSRQDAASMDESIDLVIQPMAGRAELDSRSKLWPGCDTVMVARPGGIGRIGTVAVLGSGGPFDVAKISVATRIAHREGASLRLVHVLDTSASKASVRAIESYHGELAELVEVETDSRVSQSDDLLNALTESAEGADLVVVGASAERRFFSRLTDRIIDRMEAPVLVVKPARAPTIGLLPRLLDRLGS